MYRLGILGRCSLPAAALLLLFACDKDSPPPAYQDVGPGKDLPVAADARRDVTLADADGLVADSVPDGPVDSGCAGDGSRACYTGPVGTKGVGPCIGGTQHCVGGHWGKCVGQVTPQTEVCDSKDNDCDGAADEYVTQDCYSGATGTKGVGACKAGSQLCMHGKWQQCLGQVLPASEICDNKDNDCNGKADDAVSRSCYTGAASTKGVGACKAGTQSCAAGAWGACNGEVTPATEKCDNKDNDCDGSTDEMVTQPCYTGATATKGVGSCQAGQQACSAGTWGTCTGEVTPSAELCDNKDNDCDGATDEALNQACYTGSTGTQGVGACKAGKQFCAGGKWGSCNGEVTPKVELCDNKDNNCNGKADEGLTKYCYSGAKGTKGVGLCKEGLQLCNAGSWGTCSGEVIPTSEKCDKKDNDCDGKTDEEVAQACYTGASSTRGVGACKDGTQSCAGGVVGPCVGQVTPTTEKCDNKDNDCDGKTDESVSRGCYTGTSSTRGVGVCKDGYQSCAAGKWGSCNGQVTPTTEKCDNSDNDCDGKTDESLSRSCYTGTPGTSGVGPCKGGAQSCAAGAWGACKGQVIPATEACDNKDNDCDGKTDESVYRTCYSGPSGTANVGECRKGAETCAAGKWGSVCAGQAVPSTELCDNKDNDCDGKTDENVHRPCYTGPPPNRGVGECKEGQQTCSTGTWDSCLGSVLPAIETCDGKDNDCDMSIDEGGSALCSNGNSCDGKAGCRCDGKSPCVGGVHDRCCSGSYCQNLWASNTSCGACGATCGTGEQCNAGACKCGSKQGTFGGGAVCTGGTSCCPGNTCADLQNDPKNCGSCGTACPTGKCQKGACVGSCTTNHAYLGIASSSGGGGGTFGPQRMNDNLGCGHDYHWVSAGSTPGGSWIQIVWATAVQVKRLEMDTVNAYVSECGSGNTGRTVAGGTLQYWSGSSWITVGSVSNRTNDWSFTLASPVTTTRFRIYNIHATNVTGLKSNPVILEWRIFSC